VASIAKESYDNYHASFLLLFVLIELLDNEINKKLERLNNLIPKKY
jgi:hypothetical protein